MTITCGLDLGAGRAKGALLEDGKRVLATSGAPSRGNPPAAARAVLDDMVRQANLLPGEVDYVCTTGFGRYALEERNLQVSDITSSARGAVFLHPATRHVVDIGSQSARSIAVDEGGRVLKFRMNEKCAAGGGRFVERCSKYLQVPLEEMGPRALRSAEPRMISSVCAVLAETEIINYVAEGTPVEDILMGVFLSLTQRAHGLMKYVGIRPDVTLVGGLTHNDGMVRAMRQVTGMEVQVPPHAEHAAAVGSALLGYRRMTKVSPLGAA